MYSNTTICIKLFCNETVINNDTRPHVNYEPKTETLYIERQVEENQPHQPEEFEGTTNGQTRIVRFGTKRSLRRGV